MSEWNRSGAAVVRPELSDQRSVSDQPTKFVDWSTNVRSGSTIVGVIAAIWAGLQFVHDKGRDYDQNWAAVATNAGGAGFVLLGVLVVIGGYVARIAEAPV